MRSPLVVRLYPRFFLAIYPNLISLRRTAIFSSCDVPQISLDDADSSSFHGGAQHGRIAPQRDFCADDLFSAPIFRSGNHYPLKKNAVDGSFSFWAAARRGSISEILKG